MTSPSALRATGMSERRLLFVLIAVSAISPLSLNMPLPAVPGLARALDSDVASVQLVITLYLFGMAVSQLIFGPLSDRFGRRPVVLAGLALAVVTGIAAALAQSVGWLLTARALQSFGASAGIVLGRAIIRDLYERDRAAAMMGWVTMAFVVAPMIAPTIGGLLEEYAGWRFIFALTAALAALALLVAWGGLPETRPEGVGGSAAAILADCKGLMLDRAFLTYTAIAAAFNATFFVFIGGAPHVVVDVMKLTPTAYGLWFICVSGAYMAGNAMSGRFTETWGTRKMLMLGCWIGAAGAALQVVDAMAGWQAHPAGLFLPQAVIAFGNGLLLPSAIAAAVSVNPRAAGSASGLTGFIQMSICAVLAQVAGMAVAATHSAWPVVAMILISAGVALGLAIWARGLEARE